MKVPLLDLRAQLKTIEKDLKAAINEVVDSTRYILGPKVQQLEEKIAQYVGVKYAVGTSSGTDALLASLMALGVGPGDIVITTPYSFIATAGVIARLGAMPAFVDIEPDTYNLSPKALHRWFNRNKRKRNRVKAVIPVHLFGQCADMDPILAVAGEFGLPVIEDAAQAIGARYPSKAGVKKAGSMGTCGCFSFFPSKNLGGLGDGGMVVTNDEELAQKVRILRDHGAQPKYHYAVIGGNFRLDAIQAAALLVKLPHLEKWHAMRQANARYYDENLQIKGLKKPAIAYRREYHIYNQYVIWVPDRRDELKKFLEEKQIGTEVYYPIPIHEQECFRSLGDRRGNSVGATLAAPPGPRVRQVSHLQGFGNFPVSEQAARQTLALPIYAELSREMQDYVIQSIQEYCAR